MLYHFYLISFNTAPQSFPSQINVAVTFYGNGTPIAEVSFEVSTCIIRFYLFYFPPIFIQAPFICDYQTSNLTITIKDITASTVMPALVHQSTYTGRDRIITETFDTGLLANHAYTLTVTVRDSAFAEYVSTAAVNFSKHYCHMH